MQPSLQKIRSLDCGPGAGSQKAQVAGARGSSGGQLVHSVSIIVELAKDQPANQPLEACSFASDVTMQSGSLDSASDELEAVGPSEEATLMDDDEEADACLSSDLARRVVIVDEADKILMSRAQSAEPNLAPSSLAREQEALLQGSSDNRHSRAAGEDAHRQVGGGLAGRAQGACFAASTPENNKQSVRAATCSGELAERGELSQLGRRRNTHHHVAGFAAYLAAEEGGSDTSVASAGARQRTSAQLQGEGGKLGPTTAPRDHLSHRLSPSQQPTQQLQAASNWSHRRQSLQMSLFTGSCRSNNSASKSLTEEELRGEREFNEQVRSARSPEVLASAASLVRANSPQTTVTSPAPPPANTSTSPLPTGTHLRCRSVTGGSTVGSLSSESDQAPAAASASESSFSSSFTPSPSPNSSPSPSSSSGLDRLASTGANVNVNAIARGNCTGSGSGSGNSLAFGPIRASAVVSGAGDSAVCCGPSSANRKGSYQIPHSIVKTQHKQSQQRRRVSFGSIDPIPSRIADHQHQQQIHHNKLHLLQDFSSQHQANNVGSPLNHRQHFLKASLLHQPEPNPKFSARQRLSSGSILEYIPTNQSSCRPTHLGLSETQKKVTDQHEAIANVGLLPPVGYKRHSIASNTPVERLDHAQQSTRHSNERENFWRPPSSPARGVRNNPFWLRDHQFNQQLHHTSGATTRAPLMTSSPKRSSVEKKMSTGTKKLIDSASNQSQDVDSEPEAAVRSVQMEALQGKQEHVQERIAGDEHVTSTIIEERVRDLSPSTEQRDGGRVQSIMANARLRQEEFARLLAEHEQIVNEINRVETKISSQQTANALRQQQANEQ